MATEATTTYGALVAVYVGEALLLVHSSYRTEWNFPGGGVRRAETPEAAARRELAEEIGLATLALQPAGEHVGIYDERKDHLHFFELRLDRLPELQCDNQEIVSAQLMSLCEVRQKEVTEAVAAYLNRRQPTVLVANDLSLQLSLKAIGTELALQRLVCNELHLGFCIPSDGRDAPLWSLGELERRAKNEYPRDRLVAAPRFLR